MKKIILGAASAIALLGVAACSDSGTDSTTTQSTTQPVEQTQPVEPQATPPATDDSTTQSIDPTPSTGTGGDMPVNELDGGAPKASPEPTPAQ